MLNSVPPAKEGGGTKHPFHGILPIISHRGENDNRRNGRGGAALPLKDDKKAGNSQNGGQPGGRPPQKGEKRRKEGEEGKKGKREKGERKEKGSKETKKKGGIAKKVL